MAVSDAASFLFVVLELARVDEKSDDRLEEHVLCLRSVGWLVILFFGKQKRRGIVAWLCMEEAGWSTSDQ